MIVIDREHLHFENGRQVVHRFSNNYGASVITGNGSYTLGNGDSFELAVIYFPTDSNDSFEIMYDTPITNDVLGYLTQDDVNRYLKKIEEL